MRWAGILVVAFVLAGGPGATSPERVGRPIVFLSNWTPHFRTSDLYLVGSSGGRPRNLTANELDDVDPSWSPDGTQIVFASRRGGSFDLYLMSGDGGNMHRLLSLPGDQRQPVWSPNGERIAFVSPGSERNEKGWRPDELFVMRADGSGITQVTHGEGAADPAWSPDGQTLAGSDGSIFTVNVDGSDFRELPPAVETEGDAHPSWSPDGKRLAFERGELSFSTTDVWAMNTDGSGQRRLVRFGAQPAWSPNGRRIAFVNGSVWSCDRDGCYDDGLSAIATIGANGGRRHYVTQPLERLGQSFGTPSRFWDSDGATFFGVRWSPDGRRLLYARRLDERALDVFKVSATGRLRELTHSKGIEAEPLVSPDGRRVMFARYPLGGGPPRVLVMRVDGRGARRIAAHGHVGSWSRDGRRLAYVVDSGSGLPSIHVAAADGSQRRRLLDGADPTWSPDGRRIAFVQASRPGAREAIAVANADGSGSRQLVRVPGHFLYGLAWSPTDDWVAFVDQGRYGSVVELVNAATGATRRVTPRGFWDGPPVWSADGQRLAFDRRPKDGSNTAVVVCRPDGSGAHRLGRWRWGEMGPSWSPDSGRLVLASRRDGNYEIVSARPDGTGYRRLTHNLADNVEPSW